MTSSIGSSAFGFRASPSACTADCWTRKSFDRTPSFPHRNHVAFASTSFASASNAAFTCSWFLFPLAHWISASRPARDHVVPSCFA